MRGPYIEPRKSGVRRDLLHLYQKMKWYILQRNFCIALPVIRNGERIGLIQQMSDQSI